MISVSKRESVWSDRIMYNLNKRLLVNITGDFHIVTLLVPVQRVMQHST